MIKSKQVLVVVYILCLVFSVLYFLIWRSHDEKPMGYLEQTGIHDKDQDVSQVNQDKIIKLAPEFFDEPKQPTADVKFRLDITVADPSNHWLTIQEEKNRYFSMIVSNPISHGAYLKLAGERNPFYTNVVGSLGIFLHRLEGGQSMEGYIRKQDQIYSHYPIITEEVLGDDALIQHKADSSAADTTSFRILLYKQLSEEMLLKVSLDRTSLVFMPTAKAKEINALLTKTLARLRVNDQVIPETTRVMALMQLILMESQI